VPVTLGQEAESASVSSHMLITIVPLLEFCKTSQNQIRQMQHSEKHAKSLPCKGSTHSCLSAKQQTIMPPILTPRPIACLYLTWEGHIFWLLAIWEVRSALVIVGNRIARFLYCSGSVTNTSAGQYTQKGDNIGRGCTWQLEICHEWCGTPPWDCNLVAWPVDGYILQASILPPAPISNLDLLSKSKQPLSLVTHYHFQKTTAMWFIAICPYN
jgi:hypothetical protein